jgi:hypothetical protein
MGFDFWQGEEIFPLYRESRPTLGPTQPPLLCLLGAVFQGSKLTGSVKLTTNHPVLKLRMLERYLLSSPGLHGIVLNCIIKYRDNFKV